jgi:ankyrin repeat protein
MWCKQAYVAPGRYFGKGSTPLHEAAAAGHQGIMDALLASQANLAIQDHQVC